jgi:hypothetical protein
MKLHTSALLLTLTVSPLLGATSARAETPAVEAGAARPSREEWQARRLERLAQVLELDAAGQARLASTAQSFKAQRAPLREQIKADREVLKRAAAGDPAAQGQVDGALARLQDERTRLQDLRRSEFQALSQGLSPQQRAKLALFFQHGKHGRGRHGRPGSRPEAT